MFLKVVSYCSVPVFLIACSSCKKPETMPEANLPAVSAQVNCTDWVELKLKSLPGCYESSYIALNNREDNAVVYCDIDNNPTTPPELAFHITKPGADVDSPGPNVKLTDPVCEGFDGTVRGITFLPISN